MGARGEFDALQAQFKHMADKGIIKGSDDNSNVDMTDYEEFVPPETIPFSQMGSAETNVKEGTLKPQPVEPIEEEHTYYEPQINDFDGLDVPPPKIAGEEETIWPNGPLKSELESWRKKFGEIYLVDDIHPETWYIYRTINRYEYKAIVATPNTDPLMREEMICEQCVLFPREYGYGAMSNDGAGIPTALSELILSSSGFVKASIPRRL